MRRMTFGGIVMVLVVLAPTLARADGFLSPFIGANFSGELEENKLTYGFSGGVMAGGVFGFEFDLSYSPDFFAPPEAPTELLSDKNLTTIMFNLIAGVPVGGADGPVRPYASGGLGLMLTRVASASDLIKISRNDLGVNFGFGVMGFFTDSFGIRGDLRYFRSLEDAQEGFFDFNLGKFTVWRGTIGAAFRF